MSGTRRIGKHKQPIASLVRLQPLREIVRSGKVPAQVLLDRYHGAWNGDLSRVYDEFSF